MPQPNFFSQVMGRRRFHEMEHAAYAAVYTVKDWQRITEQAAVDVLHQTFAEVDIGKELFGNPRWQTEMAERVRHRLNLETLHWGIEIRDVKFKSVEFSEMTMKNLTAEPRAER